MKEYDGIVNLLEVTQDLALSAEEKKALNRLVEMDEAFVAGIAKIIRQARTAGPTKVEKIIQEIHAPINEYDTVAEKEWSNL